MHATVTRVDQMGSSNCQIKAYGADAGAAGRSTNVLYCSG